MGGRNITLDIFAKDKDGQVFDVKVQRNTEGSHVRRARFHSSSVDTRILREKEAAKEQQIESFKNALEMGLTVEQAKKISTISDELVAEILQESK